MKNVNKEEEGKQKDKQDVRGCKKKKRKNQEEMEVKKNKEHGEGEGEEGKIDW